MLRRVLDVFQILQPLQVFGNIFQGLSQACGVLVPAAVIANVLIICRSCRGTERQQSPLLKGRNHTLSKHFLSMTDNSRGIKLSAGNVRHRICYPKPL